MAMSLSLVVPLAGAQEADVPAAPIEKPTTGEESAPPSFVLVEGQLTDHIGAGHAGMKITVYRKTDDGKRGEVIASAATNQYGDFSVTAPQPFHGGVIVSCVTATYKELVREFHLGDEDYPPYLAETLEGKLVVIGRVFDASTSKPVAGASVELKAVYKDWTTESDEQGRFTIKGVYPGRGELVIEADRYGREVQTIKRLEDFGEILIHLKPQRIVHLAILDENKAPIRNVSIECYDQARDDFRVGVTDDQGRLTLDGLHFDAVTLTVRLTHEDYVSSSGFDRTISAPKDKTESTHELAMKRAGRISGLITEAASGEGLNGARLVVGDHSGPDLPRDWSNYKGEYTVGGIPPGPAAVTVYLAGYAPDLATIVVEAGQNANVDFKLRQAASVHGVVKSESDRPVPGVWVAAISWRGHNTLGLRAITDHDGRFVIDNAPHDVFEVSVAMPGAEPITRVVSAGRKDAIEIVLPDSAIREASLPGSRFSIGDEVPGIKMTTLDGQTVDLAELRGKTVLLDFWATWCAPCVADLPHLVEVYEKFGSRKDFVMIGVSLDGDEEILKDFIKKKELAWPQVFGEGGHVEGATQAFGVRGIPAVFLIDPYGKIAGQELTGSELVNKVRQVLSDNDPT